MSSLGNPVKSPLSSSILWRGRFWLDIHDTSILYRIPPCLLMMRFPCSFSWVGCLLHNSSCTISPMVSFHTGNSVILARPKGHTSSSFSQGSLFCCSYRLRRQVSKSAAKTNIKSGNRCQSPSLKTVPVSTNEISWNFSLLSCWLQAPSHLCFRKWGEGGLQQLQVANTL